MKLNFGLRFYFILIFLVLFTGSLYIVNQIFLNQQKVITNAFENIDGSSLRDVTFRTAEDSLVARDILNQINQAKALTTTTYIEVQSYSWLFIFLIALVAVVLFILLVLKFSNPLIQLQKATELIQKGYYDINLPIKGIKELRELKKSFNLMSKELSNTRDKLIESEKQAIWKDLSRALAHEIKNPLTPIQLALQRLEEKYSRDKQSFYDYYPQAQEIIQNEVQNLLTIAKNFSTFTKLVVPEKEKFNPAETLASIVDSYNDEYIINLNLDKSLYANFDPQHFYQIITNILQNAIDATDRETPIDIRLYEEHGLIIVCVEDYGCGIEREDISRIFNPYFTKKTNGNGLGLALVKKFIEANGSTIYVNSKIGIGTKFRFSLEQAN